MSDPTFVSANVCCSTDGCVNEGVVLTVQVDSESPSVQCGPCGESIALIPPGDD